MSLVSSVAGTVWRSRLICGSLFMCAVGVWDDVRGLKPRYKLLAQVCAAVFAYALGFRIEGFDIPFVGPTSVGVLSPFLTVLWIVGITNAVNLIDGLDGLAAVWCFLRPPPT